MTVFIMMVATVCQTPSIHNASSLPLAWWVQWLLESEDFCQDSWGWDRSPACQALESGFFTAPWVAPPPGLLYTVGRLGELSLRGRRVD